MFRKSSQIHIQYFDAAHRTAYEPEHAYSALRCDGFSQLACHACIDSLIWFSHRKLAHHDTQPAAIHKNEITLQQVNAPGAVPDVPEKFSHDGLPHSEPDGNVRRAHS
jgi:hypothetical protein